jgi:hypothetical protein
MTAASIEHLSRQECLERLRTKALGRVGVAYAGVPAIFPVYYGMLGDDVIFRADPGTELDAAFMKSRVAFEVDDDAPGEAWSVLVVGHAEEVTGRRELANIDELALRPWPSGRGAHTIRIRGERITGRAVTEHLIHLAAAERMDDAPLGTRRVD